MKTAKVILSILGAITFVFLIGLAGNVDWTEQVILHMTQEQYDTVKQHLTNYNGDEPSEYEIARWWAEHHK